MRQLLPVTWPGATLWIRAVPLLVHLMAGTLAYAGGYLLIPTGRRDLIELATKLLRR